MIVLIKNSFKSRLLSILFLIIGISNPQIGTKMEEVKREGVDLMIAVDLSYSMMSEDIKPNRLERAKQAISRLIDMGNSVVIIEHNTELIKQADWIIDMGPEGGDKGGEICYQGTPIDLIKIKNNKTAKYLKNQFVKH